MKKNIFHSADFWKSAVMTMPDNSFYELLRSVFGKIKTPFNKQQLLKDLESFLLREDIQKTIAAYIDENDAKIIASAGLLSSCGFHGGPTNEELENFLCGELSYVQLQDLIVNLEERFILYRFYEENQKNAKYTGSAKTFGRLALNPVLKQILSPVAEDTSPLFPAVPETEFSEASAAAAPKAKQPVLNDRIIAGLLSFVSEWDGSHSSPAFYRSEGVIRKQALDAGKNCFPGINLEQVLGSLQILGLFYAGEDKLIPDKDRFGEFASLSARQRSEFCAAALMLYKEISSPESPNHLHSKLSAVKILPPLYKNRFRETALFIHGFFESLDTKLLYPEKTLKRLAHVLKARTETAVDTDLLFEAMENAGLLTTLPSGYRKACSFAHNDSAPSIALDSGFSVLVYPEISFADAISLAAFLNIKEAGAAVRFELEKDSAVRAFNNNISADEIIDLLNRLSSGKVSDTLVWNLKDWEKRHSEVSLKKGVVLTLAEDKRYLAKTMPLSAMIKETLADGIYLLGDAVHGEDTIKEAAAALNSAGIDIIARHIASFGSGDKTSSRISAGNYFSLPKSQTIDITACTSNRNAKKPQSGQSAITEQFHDLLNKMQLGKPERDELSARIDRRLVLCETQLKEANIRYEKLEARHMDYAGKQNIAKQAIAQQSPVEIVWQNGKQIFGMPTALEKEDGSLVLVVQPAGKTGEMRIPLAKISLLRRIKKSIFEG